MKVIYLILVLAAITYIECKHHHYPLTSESKYVIYDLSKAGELFVKYQKDYGKHYSSPEETRHRFELFKHNLKEINKINSEHLSWIAGVNQFTDLDSEEASEAMGFGPPKKKKILLPRRRRASLFEVSSSE